MSAKETAVSRVAVTRTTHQRLRDFSRGLGVSQDDAIRMLLDLALRPEEDELLAGHRFRQELHHRRRKNRGTASPLAPASDPEPASVG